MRIRPFLRRAIILAAPLALATAALSFGQATGPYSGSGYPNGAPGYSPDSTRPASQASQPIAAILDWTPPEIADLSTQASSKTSFAFDRSMLQAMASLEGDNAPEFRQAFAKLDGVSVNLLRFGPGGIPNRPAIESLRAAYHVRGLKHVVTSTNTGGPMHSGTTDVWLVLDGVNVKGAVILGETAKSVTLVTVKGDISPADLFRLRGHFGIPKLDRDDSGVRGLGTPENN